MLDNSFRARYGAIPIAIYAKDMLAAEKPVQFVHPHHHSEFEIILVTRGSCEAIIGKASYIASVGDLLIIPPHLVHYGYSLPGEGFCHRCLCFDLELLEKPEYARSLEHGAVETQYLIPKGCRDWERLYTLADGMFAQCEQQKTGWEMVVGGQARYIFGLLEQNGYLSCVQQEGDDFIIRLCNLMETCYATDISSKEMADRMSYSHGHFCRMFRRFFAMRFRDYLCDYRLCKARVLLLQGNQSVTEVAAQVGFNSISYFVRKFHEKYGCTPKQFGTLQMALPSSERKNVGKKD